MYLGTTASVIIVTAIVWLSHHPSATSVPLFYLLNVLLFSVAALLVWHFQHHRAAIPFGVILASAVVLRLIAITGMPLFEDDFYRYLFDGYMMATTGDPYSSPPAAFFVRDDLPLVIDDLLSLINYPDIATVYGPVCQLVFALAWIIAPGSVWIIQLFAAIADVAVLLLLATLSSTILQRNCLWLYACSPLLIKEFALSAHPDIYAILFGVAALAACFTRKYVVCGLLLALAVGAKVFALLLLPFLVIHAAKSAPAIRVITGFVAGIVLITLIFGNVMIWLPEGLGAMARYWIFNAPFYTALLPLLPFTGLKIGMLLTLLAMSAWLFFSQLRFNYRNPHGPEKDSRLFQSLLMIYAALLLCLPALNPWYVAWLLPLAVLSPSRWPWIWSALVLLAYFTSYNLSTDNTAAGDLHAVPAILIGIQFGGVVISGLFDRYRPIGQQDASGH